MIQAVFIKNFKAFSRETIILSKHNIFIGENDSGKTTVLQALDIFFNHDKVDKIYVREEGRPVEIGILYNNIMYKKIYTGSSYRESQDFGNNLEISNIKYIYIPVSSYDPKQLISQLAAAKALQNTPTNLINQLKDISQNSINEVINSINNELLIIDGDNTQTIGSENFKYESSLKFTVTNNGVPIESRGSGFQKNLMYALLIGNNYQNVILGIDEIENSFSVNNCRKLLLELQRRIGQTLITTHSKKIIEVRGEAGIIPFYSQQQSSLIELLLSLDNNDDKKYLLVEGKFDIPWFERGLQLLGIQNQYIVLPGCGSQNIGLIKNCLERQGKECITIKDGDTFENGALKKECIELYTPLEVINEYFDLNLEYVPETKNEFFELTSVQGSRNKDSVKSIISSKVHDFLTEENEFVQELGEILLQRV